MSRARIIQGTNADIKSVSASQNAASSIKGYGLSSFRSMKVEGTFSQSEVEESAKNAKAEGKKEGIQEAEKKLTAPVKTGLENIENILEELSRFRGELFKEAEEEIMSLLKLLTKKIVQKEMSLQPDLLKEIVAKGVEQLETERKIRMIVSPKNHDLFKTAKADYLERFKGVETIEISVDPQLPPASVILETTARSLDVQIDKMIDQLLDKAQSDLKTSTEVNGEEAH